VSGTGAQAVTTHSVSLGWAASGSTGVVGYEVYQATVSGGPYTKLTSAPVPAVQYTDPTVESGQTYYYVVTAINSSNKESAHSNEAAAAIP
jgi:fibronectin type 3 domain-containing protein